LTETNFQFVFTVFTDIAKVLLAKFAVSLQLRKYFVQKTRTAKVL